MQRSFGEKLRYLRQHLGLTQAMLARHLNASRAYINNLEAGRKIPSPGFVVQIAVVFGVTTDYLLDSAVPVESTIPTQLLQAPTDEKLAHVFGMKLRHLRKIKHLTQVQVIDQLGLRSQAHISLVEAGVNEPSLSFVLQIADLFGVTTEYLLRDTIPVDPVVFKSGDEVSSLGEQH
jgi:transcriptional regulator with XRE-family HTH domain